jgi:hypothetical protein
MKELIRKILNEITFSKERADQLKKDYGWRYSQNLAKKDRSENFVKGKIFTFVTPERTEIVNGEEKTFSGFKYIVEIEEYKYDFFIISFYPKLPPSFHMRQSKLSSWGSEYTDKYSYKTNEKITIKILSLMISEIEKILSEKPNASFAYFGAADKKTGSDEDIENTKRVRIYNNALANHFKSTHELKSEEKFSGSILINKKVKEKYPEIIDYYLDILMSHL